MRFTVIWNQVALDQMAEAWLQATDRERISEVSNTIDRHLADDPQSKGIDHYGDRLLEVDDFSVIFDYVEDDRLVRILDFSWRH